MFKQREKGVAPSRVLGFYEWKRWHT